jgi:hypothetical protein
LRAAFYTRKNRQATALERIKAQPAELGVLISRTQWFLSPNHYFIIKHLTFLNL